jgi:hypothetical protein
MTRFEKFMLVLFIECNVFLAFAILEDVLFWKLVGVGAVIFTQALFINRRGQS